MKPDVKIYVAGHRGLAGPALVRRLSIPSPLKGEGRGEGKVYTNLITRTHAELDLTDQAAVRAFSTRKNRNTSSSPPPRWAASSPTTPILPNSSNRTSPSRPTASTRPTNGVKRLLFLGSSCIYPRDCPQPIKEEYLLTGPLEPTNRPYALAKIAGIEMCWSYNRQYGTQFLAVMPTNLYGPGDNYDLEKSHVIPAMIRKFHLVKLASEGNWPAIEEDERRHGPIPAALRQELEDICHRRIAPRVTLWGTGTPRREFMYSDDMADASVYLMNLPDEQFIPLLAQDRNAGLPPLVNIGVGEDLSIQELAELVKKLSASRVRFYSMKRSPKGRRGSSSTSAGLQRRAGMRGWN